MKQQSGYLSDTCTSEDGLKYDAYRSALLEILQNGATPLTVGVFGTWGSGKSSLLQMLKKSIDEKRLANLRTMWFTAWKYEHEEALWRAFLLQVVGGLFPRKEDGSRYPVDDLSDETQKEGVRYLERLERTLYETVSWQEKGDWSLDLVEVKKVAIHVPIWLAFKLAGLGDFAKDLGINPDLAKTLEREIRDHHLNQLQSMEQFASEFEKAVHSILGNEGRLVIFVDDLDRCLPEKAVEILEAIKLFLDVPGVVFVLGMDREIVRRGVETHYRSIMNISAGEKGGDEVPIDGDLYLQKIIQIPFNLPPLDLDNRRAFIEFQVDCLPEDYRLDAVTREVMARGLFPNPRQVKRALNVFNLLRQVAKKQEEQGLIPKGSISWQLLAKAVLIQSQWPELYQKWRQYPRMIQYLEEKYTQLSYSEEDRERGISFDPSRKSRQSLSSGTAESLPAPEIMTDGGEAEEYLRNLSKYSLLFDMLRYPDPNDKNESQARFAGLSKAQMRLYLGLTASTESGSESGKETVAISSQWGEYLASGDEIKINEVLADIEEKEQDESGPLHKSIRQMLVNQLQNQNLPTRVRVSSGDTLARLGDPRPEVMTVDGMRFCFVPAGEFWYGEGNEARKENLPDFWLAEYPVSHAQYRAFLAEDGYLNGAWWTEARKDGRWSEQGFKGRFDDEPRTAPVHYGERFDLPNHPVVGVSWYEAMAFTHWLTARWQEKQLLPQGWQVSLPHEYQWEKAARGGLQIPAAPHDLARELPRIQSRPLPGLTLQHNLFERRDFPWADGFNANNANAAETGIGATSALGCFPLGASPYGIQELSGSVWEWQVNWYDKDKDSKALRGGSWINYRNDARVSYRNWDDPYSGYYDFGFRCVLSPTS